MSQPDVVSVWKAFTLEDVDGSHTGVCAAVVRLRPVFVSSDQFLWSYVGILTGSGPARTRWHPAEAHGKAAEQAIASKDRLGMTMHQRLAKEVSSVWQWYPGLFQRSDEKT